MIIDKEDVLGTRKNPKNYEYENKPIWRSHMAQSDVSEAKMHNRSLSRFDPFICMIDYDAAIEEGVVMYGGGG